MDRKEFFELYKSLTETWRFEVNSHWQRSSYFAAFETLALAACWKLLSDDAQFAGCVLSALGICLTVVWFLSNRKTHFYAVYWLNTVSAIERKLALGEEGVDFATQILNRPRTDLIKHRHLVQAVPLIFFTAWTGLFLRGVYKCVRH
jgi:hypothetical protein